MAHLLFVQINICNSEYEHNQYKQIFFFKFHTVHFHCIFLKVNTVKNINWTNTRSSKYSYLDAGFLNEPQISGSSAIIKSVPRFWKSYCDIYLYLFLVKGTFHLNTRVDKIMGNGAIPLYYVTMSNTFIPAEIFFIFLSRRI